MDLRKLKKLIDLVQESGIGELEITEGEEKVRISRVGPGAPVVIGAGAVVGMGAVVLSSVAAGETVVGTPARNLSRGEK